MDRRRVAALALTLSAHVVAVGVLVLPDVRALETRHAADAVGAVEDRLTLFVELPSPPPAPLPVAPAPPPPPPRPVPAIPMRAAAPAPDAPRESVPAPVPAAPVLIAIANPQAPLAAPAAVLATPAATPTPATSAQARRERDAYIRALMAALLQHRSYPPEARRERARGVVQLRFTVSRDGRVLASQVARSAGHPMLDEAALAVLAAADPLPAIPPSLGRETLTVTVPVEYSLITR
ncbi:MAG: TonB family protein [Rhodanobacteraceae bacterium]|nr:TonB family protein [Rhodanobacteraceae bacterium]